MQSVQFGKASVSVLPNPTHDFIEIKNIESVKTLELFDQNGRLLREFSKAVTNRLDLRDLPNGVYHLKIGTGATFSVVKVVKM